VLQKKKEEFKREVEGHISREGPNGDREHFIQGPNLGLFDKGEKVHGRWEELKNIVGKGKRIWQACKGKKKLLPT